MIIYDYSFQYQIKPIKVVVEHVELRDQIDEITTAENLKGTSVRILLTVNSEEIVIHYPSHVSDEILDDIEKELRNLHEKMSLFVADTIITLDLFVQENRISNNQFRDLIIVDLLSFNGIDYRSTELRIRRRLSRTFFQGFISSPNLKISDLLTVFSSQQELNSSSNPSMGTTKENLFGISQSDSIDNETSFILIRDEKSSYNEEDNDEWVLIDVQTIPVDLRVQF